MLDVEAKGNSLLLGMGKKKKKGLGKIWILVLEEVIDPKMEKVWIYGMQGG